MRESCVTPGAAFTPVVSEGVRGSKQLRVMTSYSLGVGAGRSLFLLGGGLLNCSRMVFVVSRLYEASFFDSQNVPLVNGDVPWLRLG